MLAVQGRTLARKEALFPEFTVALPPEVERGASGITLRTLLERVVREQVAAFDARQTQRQFLRALTEREIADGAQRGKITAGESEVPRVALDAEHSVATALQAFEDGLYLVFVDGVEQKELERQLFLRPESRLLFVRLALLVGG